MYSLPQLLRSRCREILGTEIQSVRDIGGGDINQARLLETEKGSYFLKMNSGEEAAAMFQAEAKGLQILACLGIFKIPEVIGFGREGGLSFLLMEFVESGPRTASFWEDFGRSLARLHRRSDKNFGLDHDNFIGALPQKNNRHPDWASFFIEERLQPQIELANRLNKLQASDNQRFEKLFQKISELCPEEMPALTHGDLWSGNFLSGPKKEVVLIDPAVSYAHREMDMAMTRLFGGFDSKFYNSYENAFPLEPGFEGRVAVYQLYYLLVHVNLFGGGYVNSVRSILKKIA